MSLGFFSPAKEKRVSPREYIDLYRKQKDNIESVSFIPPRFGKPEFGGMIVRFKTPLLQSGNVVR